MFIEINLRETKWLIFGSYHPPSQSDQYYFDNVGQALDTYNSTYEKSLFAGDFNAEEREACLMDFMYHYDLKNLVKEKTCFKSIANPSCIDLLLTNHPKCFHHSKAISCGISDFHKMIVTILNTTFCKAKPQVIYYRRSKKFDKNTFRAEHRQKPKNCKSSNYSYF